MNVNRGFVLRSFVWKLLERGGTQVVLFLVTIILARLLTPDDYGTVALVMVLISLATVFVEGGLNTALIQKKNSDQVDYSTIFYFSLFIAFIVYIILFLSAPCIAKFYYKPELNGIIKILGICLFSNAINSVQRAFLYQNMLFSKLFYCSLIGALISAGIGIAMAYCGYGIWALVAQQLILSVLTTLVMAITVKWRPSIVFSKNRFKTLFDFGWKIFLSNLFISIFINVRSLIIGRLFSASSLAYFDRGKQFPTLFMDNINSAIQSVMFSVLSKQQDQADVVKAMVKRTTQVSCYVIYPFLIILAIIAKPLTIIILTEKWINIVPFIQIFCIANMLIPIQNVNKEAIKSLGYSNITLKLEMIKKIIEIVILITSVFIGVQAIAWGVVLFNAICVYINLSPCKKALNYGVKEQLKNNFPSFAIAIVTLSIILPFQFLNFTPWGNITFNTLAIIFVYLGLSELFKIEPYMYLKNNVISKI